MLRRVGVMRELILQLLGIIILAILVGVMIHDRPTVVRLLEVKVKITI